jgi:hypothetical protein
MIAPPRWTSLALIALFAAAPSPAASSRPWPDQVPVVDGPWWQIATEDFDAGEWSNKPAPGAPAQREHQEVSDFTIYQAADGTWQLVSAVRQTKFPGNHHFLFRWEATDLTATHWREKGVFWTSATTPDAGYEPGVIYAPHCVRDQGVYSMFHSSADHAWVLTSRDGKTFEQARARDGRYAFFPLGEAGRDLMIFDNRARDGLWYAYFASVDRTRPELEARRWHDVFACTARDLAGPWSERFAVGLATADRPKGNPHRAATFVNAESPVVFFHDGFYFKLEQTHIAASRSPRNFDGAPIVSDLYPDARYPEDWWRGLAPEIIEHAGTLYVAVFQNHGTRPLAAGGIFVARLKWVPRPAVPVDRPSS